MSEEVIKIHTDIGNLAICKRQEVPGTAVLFINFRRNN
jgi:hypothetical protein